MPNSNLTHVIGDDTVQAWMSNLNGLETTLKEVIEIRRMGQTTPASASPTHDQNVNSRYGQLKQVIERYNISRSTFVRLRDTDPDFPTWFKRGKLCVYDFTKLDNYFSA